MNQFFLLSLLFFNLVAVSQPLLFNQQHNEALDFGLSEKEIEAYKSKGYLEVFNEKKHNTKLAKKLFNKKVGKSHTQKGRTENTIYTVVAEAKNKHYRVDYIFLDGNKYDYEQIQKIRKKVKQLLDDGVKFESVARQYSMDRNSTRGGDSGWFKKEKTTADFYNAITNPKYLANETFEIDLPEKNWYYLVRKNYTPTSLNEILILVEKESLR